VALAKALSLLERGYDKIVLIKSVTTIPGESIGYIPGCNAG
jgi:predicted ribonuclease YlaK